MTSYSKNLQYTYGHVYFESAFLMVERFPYSSDLPAQTALYLHSFEGLDVNQVGKIVGKGIGHTVHEYHDPDSPFPDKVIKIPRYRDPYIEPPNAARRIAELQVMRQYFAPYMLPTEILTSNDHPYYASTQPRLRTYAPVSPSNIDEVYASLCDLLERNYYMIRDEGCCIDMLGKEGVEASLKALVIRQANPIISNLVINRDGNNDSLTIMDSFPIPLRRAHYQTDGRGTRSWLSAQNTYWINKLLIRHHWGLVIG